MPQRVSTIMSPTQGAFDQTYNVIAANMSAHLLNQNRVATVLLILVLANRVVLAEKSLEHGAHL